MSLLNNLSTGEDIGGEERDSLGGRQLFESNAYPFTVKLAYLLKSDGGALGLHVVLKMEDDKELRQSFYITNKKGENFYVNNKGEKNYLPGFNMAQSLALLTTGKDLVQLDHETKTINLYNSALKAEAPTKVEMIMDMLDKPIWAGVLKQLVNKNEKVGDEYVPTAETREENEIDKFFCGKEGFEKLTATEIKAGVKEPTFFNDWVKKWEGVLRDKTKKDVGQAGAPGKPAAGAANTPKPSNSLFGTD